VNRSFISIFPDEEERYAEVLDLYHIHIYLMPYFDNRFSCKLDQSVKKYLTKIVPETPEQLEVVNIIS